MSPPTFRRHPPQLAVAAGGDGGDGGPPSRRLAMTPQLQQAIRLLQLSRLELIAEIRRELDANPVLADVESP